ncbi:uncharacterized protein LOC144162763 isoform X2 [Haemaphysalis longicornis]
MTSYRLAALLAIAVFLIAAASAGVTEKPERLDFNASDVRASYVYDRRETGGRVVIVRRLKPIVRGIIAAVIGAFSITVACCVRCCKARAQKKETPTVVNTGAPGQQQFPAEQQQCQPQASAPTYSTPIPLPYAPLYPPPYSANQGPPVHQRY